MSLFETNFEPLPPQPIHYGWATMLGSIVFFQLLNFVVKSAGPPKFVKTDFWKWRNLFISWIHALIVGIWDILCFWFYPEMWANLVFYHNAFIYFMVAFSTGYFMYDFLDIIICGRLKASWEVVVHHIFVSGIFLYNLVTCQCLAYTVIALMAEINSIFLHPRKLMQMAGVDFGHPCYRGDLYVNMVTFVVGRFGALVVLIGGMHQCWDFVSTGYLLVLGSSLVVTGVINVILFWRLLKNDFLRPFGLIGNTPKKTTLNNNKEKE